ncbi:MAG: DNA polymerase III subunit [Verrucomicrobiota bacterium]
MYHTCNPAVKIRGLRQAGTNRSMARMAFGDFPEQQAVVGLLQRSLERGRLGHAYLFIGDRLEELESVARTLAKTLNCTQPPRRGANGVALDCCDHCLACRKIDDGNHADVQWVRPESKLRVIQIDQVREVLHTVHLKPTEAEYKVSVLVAAERMNVNAANAFLKTLEEPPAKSVMILLTTDPQRMLETILSRCLRLVFAGGGRKVAAEEVEWLKDFSGLASGAQAGLLNRYRLLDSLLTRLAGKREAIEKALEERSALERYEDLDPKLRERLEDELAAAIEAEYRRQRVDLLATVQWWLRDVWLRTMAVTEELMCFPQLAGASDTVARRISREQAAENLVVLERTQRLLGGNVQEALTLEVGLLKLNL